MPGLSFSVFLPELLSGKKIQTMRPLFPTQCKYCGSKKIIHGSIIYPDKEVVAFFCENPKCEKLIQEGWKKSRIKIEDQLYMYWKMRCQPICKNCIWFSKGDCTLNNFQDEYAPFEAVPIWKQNLKPPCFTHKLPTRTCTEAFVVEMGKSANGKYFVVDLSCIENLQGVDCVPSDSIHHIGSKWLEDLARRDSGGVWNADDMFGWFDSHYDLSQEKQFAVTRW